MTKILHLFNPTADEDNRVSRFERHGAGKLPVKVKGAPKVIQSSKESKILRALKRARNAGKPVDTKEIH
jgi:hypothetical protein